MPKLTPKHLQAITEYALLKTYGQLPEDESPEDLELITASVTATLMPEPALYEELTAAGFVYDEESAEWQPV